MSELEILAGEAASWMRGRAPGVEAEVYLSSAERRSLSRREGRREAVETETSRGAGVRVLKDGRMGFASAQGADAELLRALYQRACEQLSEVEPERGRALPGPAAEPADAELAASLWDESLLSRPWDALEQALAEAEAASRGASVLRAELGESRGESVIANSKGLLARERGGSAWVSVAAAAKGRGELQVAESYRSSRRFDELALREAGAEAARRALAGLDARRARAGRRAVVFEPWVGAELLELLAGPLSAEELQSGRSMLEGKLGRAIASPLVTLRDEPRRRGGPASAWCDDEGVPTRDKAMLERGVLRALFHDSTTAGREGAASNGCAYRGGWDGPPSPGPSNFFLAPGELSREALIAGTGDGLLVLEALGLHTADPVSGEFSIGVSGLEIEKGVPVRPFKGAMIAGNVLDLLARVDAAASDLRFEGGCGAPTFRVSALDVV